MVYRLDLLVSFLFFQFFFRACFRFAVRLTKFQKNVTLSRFFFQYSKVYRLDLLVSLYFSRDEATLYEGVSVGRMNGPSVRRSDGWSVGR